MKKYNSFTSHDLTFVVCAYKECKYLEDAIKSLINQTEKSKIKISTSTPNTHINNLAHKYNIDVVINEDPGQIKDYNFAMKQADTKLIMLMHQDEILDKYFTEKVINSLNNVKNPIIAFTNYKEIHDDKVSEIDSTLVKVKRFMLIPAKSNFLMSKIFGKRLILRFGDPITHPSVVSVVDKMPKVCFKEEYKASMDWDLWERLSKEKGSFVYIKDVLLYHRMSDDNQTVNLLKNSNARYDDQLAIYKRFWPGWIARIFMKFYSKSDQYY